jgi:hypothetical protein
MRSQGCFPLVELVSLNKENETRALFLPWEYAVRILPSANQEEGPHQAPDQAVPPPLIWGFSIFKIMRNKCLLFKTRSLW